MDHKPPSPEELLSHTKWLTAFARTLVLDESRADDLTQQALLEALERPPRNVYALRSWFSKVIRHLAYKSTREEANRKQREKRIAKREGYRSTVSHMLERAELNRVIVEIVLDLPECLRDTVLFRFFEDLSPKEIAKIYEVPVTTVRSRIDRALELLRSRLDRRFGGDRMTWCFAIIPARAVCQVKKLAAGSTPSVTIAMGGAVMSTKVVFTAVAAGAIGLAFVLGRGTKSIDEDEAKRQFNLVDRGSLELLAAEVDGLRTNESRLKARQSDAFRENQRLQSENERLKEEIAGLVARADGQSAVGDGENLIEGQASSVDWDKLSELFRNNRELLGAATKNPKALNEDPLAIAKVMAFLGEASKLAEAMRDSSPYPFFDPEFLPEIVRAVQGRPLDLSENQLKELTEIAETSLQETLTDFEVESALPIERLQKRLGVVRDISESMDSILTDAQMDNWSDFRAASESALRGVLRIRDLPIDVELGDSDPVVDHWKTGYSLNDDQVEFATTLANNYRAEAKRILERQQERGQLNDQLLRLQVRMEQELMSTLSEEQAETARSRPATLLRFNAEGKSGGKTSGFAGFSF